MVYFANDELKRQRVVDLMKNGIMSAILFKAENGKTIYEYITNTVFCYRLEYFDKFDVIPVVSDIIIEYSSDPSTLETLGVFLNNKRNCEAEKAFLKAASLAPENVLLINRLLCFYYDNGDRKRALSWMKKLDALEKKGTESYETLVNKTALLWHSTPPEKLLDMAQRAYELEIKKNNENESEYTGKFAKKSVKKYKYLFTQAAANYIAVLNELHRFDEALALFEKIISDKEFLRNRIEPDSISCQMLFCNGIHSYLNSSLENKFDRSIKITVESIKLFPKPELYALVVNWACVYNLTGNVKKAKACLNRALKMGYDESAARNDEDLAGLFAD